MLLKEIIMCLLYYRIYTSHCNKFIMELVISPHLSLGKIPGLCALLLALLMTECLGEFYEGSGREKRLKGLLVKGLCAADSVLSDNQDKAVRVSSALQPLLLCVPIPGS